MAIWCGGKCTAAAKFAAMQATGVSIVDSPSKMGKAMSLATIKP
ncbi:MAG: hypothetical protein ACOYMG_23300 [Candidatus Methylumidiphilus sp.]